MFEPKQILRAILGQLVNVSDRYSESSSVVFLSATCCWCHCHYENTPMQYTAIFHGCKNDNFQMKYCDFFLIFAQNIYHGYTVEPPLCGGSNEYPQSMF